MGNPNVYERSQKVILWLGGLAVVCGLLIYGPAMQWHSGRAAELVLVALFFTVLAKILGRVAALSTATWIVLLMFIPLIYLCGPIPVMSTLLLTGGSLALGSRLVPNECLTLQLLLGLALFSSLAGWLLPLPLHYGWSYAVILVLSIAINRNGLRMSVSTAIATAQEAFNSTPRIASFALMTLALASTACWLPTMQFDDLSYHLRLPWELQQSGRYSLDPTYQVWALSPWAGDVLQAIPQLMAGSEARGPVNLMWLLIAGSGSFRLAKLVSPMPAARWLAVALLASVPLTAALAAGMQTELATAATLIWLTILVYEPQAGGDRRWLAIAALAGFLIALKLLAGIMAMVVVLNALARLPWPQTRHVPMLLAVGIFVGGSSYVYATWISGNPFLPLFNEWFHSSYFRDDGIIDSRWQAGFSPLLPWTMTFSTGSYLEAYGGGIGFSLVGLAGAWLLAFRHRRLRMPMLLATVLMALPLSQMQYARYAFPAMALLYPLLAAVALRIDPRHGHWLLIGLCVLNLAFQANGHWMLRVGALKSVVKEHGDADAAFLKFTPERILASKIRSDQTRWGNVLLLSPGRPYAAEFGHFGRSTDWYSPSLQRMSHIAERDSSGKAWAVLLRTENISEVLLQPSLITPTQSKGLELVGARVSAQSGDTQWLSLQKPVAQSP